MLRTIISIGANVTSNSSSHGNDTSHGSSPFDEATLEAIHTIVVAITGIFMVVAIVVSLVTVVLHLLNYTKPAHQVCCKNII